MKEKPFNLSDFCLSDRNQGKENEFEFYLEEDVKEFIHIIKDDIAHATKRSIETDAIIIKVFDIINKRAGKSLVEKENEE